MRSSLKMLSVLALLALVGAGPALAETAAPAPNAEQQAEMKALHEKIQAEREKVKAGREKIKAEREKMKPAVEQLKADTEKMKALRAKAKAEREARRSAMEAKIKDKVEAHKARLGDKAKQGTVDAAE